VTITRKCPADLLLVVTLLVLTDIFMLVPALNNTFLRLALGLPMVLFLPGYTTIAVLFPSKSNLDGVERIALSFGLSIAVVPFIEFGLNYTPWGIRLLPILIILSVFTLFMCWLAYLRRKKLPENEAVEVPFREIVLSLKAEILEKPKSKLDKTLMVFLILSILLSAVTLLYVIVNPKEGENFTEFYILGHGGKTDNYPTEYLLGENYTLIVGIVNHEYRPINYTMEVRLENKSVHLPENLQHMTLAQNQTWEEPVVFIPSFEGQNMKLEFLLFNETEKTLPYRDLYLWINVIKNPREA
jgi:uncharacterized membrane protein